MNPLEFQNWRSVTWLLPLVLRFLVDCQVFVSFFFIFSVEKQFEKTTGRSARKLLTLNINN